MLFNINDAKRFSKIAIRGPYDRAWTFGELAARVTLCQRQLGRRRRLIFIFCRLQIDCVCWYLAGLDGGHVVALLDGAMRAEWKHNLFLKYRPDIVVDYERPGPDYLPLIHNHVWRRRNDHAEILHPALGLLLPTSGTTGNPKLVRLTRKNIETNAISIAEALRIEPEDRAIASLPIHYSYGLSVLNTHLLCGAQYILTEWGLVSDGFWNDARKCGATSFAGVPYSYEILRKLGLKRVNLPTLIKLTQAGGKLDNGNIQFFYDAMARRGGTFHVMYGQTEATARISVLRHAEVMRKLGSVGLPIPGGSVSIRTEAQTSGELIYRGPNVMMGYAVNREDLARGDELKGCLYTGDIARIDTEGYIYIIGRASREAKIFGFRLNLDDIESFLKPYGPTAAVAALDKVIVFCEFDDSTVYRKCRRVLAKNVRLPSDIFIFRNIENIPVKSCGKTDYQALSTLLVE